MGEALIRPAVHADLTAVAAIWYQAATEGEANAPPLTAVPSLYLHEIDTQELVVLEQDHAVIAYAAVINRGPIAFLADLFVHTAYRSSGFGRRLLEAVLPQDGRTCCTVASKDPRALPLYVRFGMRPCWPHIHLRAHTNQLTRLPVGALERDCAVDCVLAAVRWARGRAQVLRISITGPHPALAPLLLAGFQVVEVETFCSTTNEPFLDIERYVSSGGDLF